MAVGACSPVVGVAAAAAEGDHGRLLRIPVRLRQQRHRLRQAQLLPQRVPPLLCFPCTPEAADRYEAELKAQRTQCIGELTARMPKWECIWKGEASGAHGSSRKSSYALAGAMGSPHAAGHGAYLSWRRRALFMV